MLADAEETQRPEVPRERELPNIHGASSTESTDHSEKMRITIQKIGLKDAYDPSMSGGMHYESPHVVVSVVDACGHHLESKQTSKNSTRLVDERHVAFGDDFVVYLETTFDAIKSKQGAIFFEFHHFKPSKNRISCKCYSILEAGPELLECKSKDYILELYSPITTFRRRKKIDYRNRENPSLLTEKDLFLHVRIENALSPDTKNI